MTASIIIQLNLITHKKTGVFVELSKGCDLYILTPAGSFVFQIVLVFYKPLYVCVCVFCMSKGFR